jgi:hypothetical protein
MKQPHEMFRNVARPMWPRTEFRHCAQVFLLFGRESIESDPEKPSSSHSTAGHR